MCVERGGEEKEKRERWEGGWEGGEGGVSPPTPDKTGRVTNSPRDVRAPRVAAQLRTQSPASSQGEDEANYGKPTPLSTV